MNSQTAVEKVSLMRLLVDTALFVFQRRSLSCDAAISPDALGFSHLLNSVGLLTLLIQTVEQVCDLKPKQQSW